MKKTNLLLAVLMALTMAGCREVPDDVKSRSEANNSINADADKLRENYKTSTLTEMRAALTEKISEIKALQLDNMTFSDHLTVEIPEKVKTGSYVTPDDYHENHLKIFRHFESDLDENKIFIDMHYSPYGLDYSDPEKNMKMASGCTGFVTYSKDDDKKFYNGSKTIKTYTAAEAKNSSEAYKLVYSEREIPVSEAIEKAQAFADDFVSDCDYPNGIKAVRLCLEECEDGYFYVITFAQSVNGTYALEYHLRNVGDLEESTICLQPYVYICGEEINCFAVNECLKEYKITGELDSAIDVVDAAKYISGKLSGYMKLETTRIVMGYYLVLEDWIEGDDHGQEGMGRYRKYRAEPCYIFYFDETPDKEKCAVLRLDDMSVRFVDNSR